MPIQDRILPTEVNLDLSPLYLGKDKAQFIRNLDYAQTGTSSDTGLWRRLQLVDLYDPQFQLPDGGDGYTTCGGFRTPENNTLYICAHNATGKHCIYRMQDGVCQVVFVGPELEFLLDPLYFLGTGRIAVFEYTKGEDRRTILIFTDGQARQHFLCVEDAMTTGSFDPVGYPRFKGSYDRRELISLGVIAPTDLISIKAVATPETDENLMKQGVWRWRLLYRDVYGRPSEHGVISEPFYLSDCAGQNQGCVDLTFSAGNPLTQDIVLEYQKGTTGNWSQYDTLHLWEDAGQPWYQQTRNKALHYDAATNKITYRFCANKGCVAVPEVETRRTENPLPITSESLFSIGGVLGLGGNRYGFQPFSSLLLDQVKFAVEKPVLGTGDAPDIQMRNITVWAFVYASHNNDHRIQCIWKLGDTNVFGGLNRDNIENRVGTVYGQRFGEADQAGWIGYLHGTDYTCVSTQYRLSGLSEEDEARARILGYGGSAFDGGEYVEWGAASFDEANSGIFLQKFEFKNVPKGQYIFRIANHRAKLDEDFKSTSTYYAQHKPFEGNLPSVHVSFPGRELPIDVCEKDYDSRDGGLIVEIWDLTHGANKRNTEAGTIAGLEGMVLGPMAAVAASLIVGGINERCARVTDGYIYEDQDEGKGVLPIYGAYVDMDISGDADAYQVYETDYNGFFFTTAKDRKHTVTYSVTHQCRKEAIGTLTWERSEKSGGRKSQTYYAKQRWPEFLLEPCNRIKVQGRIVDCETGAGLHGVVVALERGAAALTNRDGTYEIITYSSPGDHSVQRLLWYSGRCRVVGCDGSVCYTPLELHEQPCTNCGERTVDMGVIRLKNANTMQRGLQLEGRYRMALVGGDWMDRKSYAQTSDAFFLSIPSARDIGGFAFPKVKCRIDPAARFPLWLKTLYVSISENLAFSDFLTWVVDRFEFIDNTGKVNNLTPTQIRIHYASLSEYNKQNNFSTNSTWQFLGEDDSARVTDRVRFVANGDGTLFQKSITETVRFDKDGQYFLIDYTDDLKDLRDGALIKLVRPYECRAQEAFYEVAAIPVVNGKPQVLEFEVNAFDSYFVYRQIPTPIVVTKKVQKTSQDTSGTITITEEEESTTSNTIRAYGWPFEHHSPSDFWGTGTANRGRVSVKNDLEDIILKWDEIALSGALGTNSLANFLHYFDEARKKSFGRQYEIVAAIPKGNKLLVICTSDHFITVFDENAVRIDEQSGRAVVLSADKQLGRPYDKPDEPFGCRKVERNTICFDKGVVHWIDGGMVADVFHDFQKAVDVSKDRFKSFLRRKIKSIDRHNNTSNTGKRYLHAHINPKDVQCYISDFGLHDKSYITDSDSPQADCNDTYALDTTTGSLRKFCSFTPEWYASLSGDAQDEQFLSFKNGLPYKHFRPGATTIYNNFYGVQCTDFVRFAFTADPLLIHQFISLQVYSDRVILWAPEVRSGFLQKSRIPRNWFKRGDRYYVAPFLCNVAGNPKILFGGEPMRGRYVEVLLQGDPATRDQYNELTAIIINAIQS